MNSEKNLNEKDVKAAIRLYEAVLENGFARAENSEDLIDARDVIRNMLNEVPTRDLLVEILLALREHSRSTTGVLREIAASNSYILGNTIR